MLYEFRDYFGSLPRYLLFGGLVLGCLGCKNARVGQSARPASPPAERPVYTLSQAQTAWERGEAGIDSLTAFLRWQETQRLPALAVGDQAKPLLARARSHWEASRRMLLTWPGAADISPRCYAELVRTREVQAAMLADLRQVEQRLWQVALREDLLRLRQDLEAWRDSPGWQTPDWHGFAIRCRY